MRWSTPQFAFRACLVSAALGAVSGAVAQTVTLHYNSRPPYLIVQDNVLTGLTGSPAVAAFRAGGVPYVVVETSAKRQLKVLQDNSGLDCAVGWFKNPERETFAKFTKPIYQDEPQIVLTAVDSAKIKASDAVESVLANPNLSLLVKKSYSYGSALDALIDKYQPRREVVAVENIQMFKLVLAKKADYMFTAPEEALVTIPLAGLQASQFNLIKLAHMPKGEYRYILCSQRVPDATIAKLNAAIR